jgi:hypothetical protein
MIHIFRDRHLETFFLMDSFKASTANIIVYIGCDEGHGEEFTYRWIGSEVYNLDEEEIAPLTFLLLTGRSVESVWEEGIRLEFGMTHYWR